MSAIKRRAACEECRTKKLKCSGDQPACKRCVREQISCLYSTQKQMGRPRKRPRRELDESRNGQEPVLSSALPEQTISHSSGESGDSQPPSTASFDPWLPHTDPTWDVPLLDPSLMNVSAGRNQDCACLSSLYLSLNTLQQMEPPFEFPFSLHPLREAMGTASSVLECQECPRRFITCIQNTSIMGTLLVSVAERFSKVLEAVTSEALRANLANETKSFRLADLNTRTSHLHTGGLGCAAAFSIDLTPDEWRAMSKKVVRAEVYGAHAASGGDTGSSASRSFSNPEHASCFYFMDIIQRMYERQNRWHAGAVPDDFSSDRNSQLIANARSCPERDRLCLKLPAYAKELVKGFDWT